MLLPLLLIPEKLVNQHLVFKVDNMACVFGFENRHMKGDKSASGFVKAMSLIEAYLGSVFHVEHIPRRSNWESEIADNLSREETTDFLEKQMLKRFSNLSIPAVLRNWTDSPGTVLNIERRLLNIVIDKCEKNLK